MSEHQDREKIAELGGVMDRHLAKIGRLDAALRDIVALPPGSMGAYGKFSQAQRIAKKALEP